MYWDPSEGKHGSRTHQELGGVGGVVVVRGELTNGIEFTGEANDSFVLWGKTDGVIADEATDGGGGKGAVRGIVREAGVRVVKGGAVRGVVEVRAR